MGASLDGASPLRSCVFVLKPMTVLAPSFHYRVPILVSIAAVAMDGYTITSDHLNEAGGGTTQPRGNRWTSGRAREESGQFK